MNSNKTDVMIRTTDTIQAAQFEEISNRMCEIDGIVKFTQSQRQPNLILVVYETSKIKALNILNNFTRLGFNASLVGI